MEPDIFNEDDEFDENVKVKNITRYTYERTSFQGWRLSICRKWNQFTKYFPDRVYGSSKAAKIAAVVMRERILEDLEKTPGDPRSVFERYKDLPAYAPPAASSSKEKPTA